MLIRRTLLPSWGCSVITVSLGLTTHAVQYHCLSCGALLLCRNPVLQLHDNIIIAFAFIMRIIKLFTCIATERLC